MQYQIISSEILKKESELIRTVLFIFFEILITFSITLLFDSADFIYQ